MPPTEGRRNRARRKTAFAMDIADFDWLRVVLRGGAHCHSGRTHDPALQSYTPTAAVPAAVPLRAVIVADPVETAVTSPALVTVATASLDEDHVTGVASVVPLADFGVAVSWVVPPGVRSRVAGETATEAGDSGVVASPPQATRARQHQRRFDIGEARQGK